MNNAKHWTRKQNSTNNFDLVLTDPSSLESARLIQLLDAIQSESHRGLTLSARADTEFRRWSTHPATPLKSEAYVLLSNWFLTQSGDRHSMVAGHCETLWDELFMCRPVRRLSSPEPGRNHMMLPDEFAQFWLRISETLTPARNVPLSGAGAVAPNEKPTAELAQPILREPRDADLGTVDVDESASLEGLEARRLTIREAKNALARSFGVSPENVEITIRG